VSDTRTEETDVQRAFRHVQDAVRKRVTARQSSNQQQPAVLGRRLPVRPIDTGNLNPESSDFKLLVRHVDRLKAAGEGGSDEVKRITALLKSVERNNY
jgi:hypothetical protein